jgi:hypothetical protein
MNKEVEKKFLEICEVFEKPTEKEDAKNGFYWQLNYNSIYGGYIVRSVNVQGGGVRCIFGMARRSKAEILSFFDGILEANTYLNAKND